MSRWLFLIVTPLVSVGCGQGGREPSPTRAEVSARPSSNSQPDQKAATGPVRYRSGSIIPGWGQVIDPDGDCTITRQTDGMVSFQIPATLHEINPTKETRNAPLVVTSVEGDFRVVVQVSGEFRPDAVSNSQSSAAFHGAGLVLWVDDRNLLVLARNAWWQGGNQFFAFTPLFELFENGRPRNPPVPGGSASDFRGNSTALYLERKGDVVRGAYSNDGQNWEGWREAKVTLPRSAKIGVTAWSTAAKPFTANFDQFRILDK